MNKAGVVGALFPHGGSLGARNINQTPDPQPEILPEAAKGGRHDGGWKL